MDIVDSCSDMLSNKEVLNLLKSNHISGGSKKQTNLATIAYETISYLESTPAAQTSLKSISNFLSNLEEKKYELTKQEKIQIVNLCPKNDVELGLLIDNIEERFTDEQRLDIISMVTSIPDEQVSSKEEEDSSRKRLKV